MQKEKGCTTEQSGLPRRRRCFSGIVLGFVIAVVCFLILDKAMTPLSSDTFCASCHEMKEVLTTWQQSPHHTNPGGIKVTCISCHLPPRQDYASHLTQKALVGIKDTWVHFFGTYDQQASRKHVLETMPNDRCLSCHSNLLAMPSSRPVETVHTQALKTGRSGGYGCVTCHDALHGPNNPAPEPVEYKVADNYYCYVCHINFDGEELADVHKNANVGCAVCHGESDKHSADEDHVTPPDTMYKKSDINNSCMNAKCHPKPQLEKQIGHRPFFAGTDKEHNYCTDCHGMHNLPKRQRKWDKDTGKLTWRDGYRIQ